RHLNAIIGEFRKDKLEFLAYEGKNQGLTPIYEPRSVEDRLHLSFIHAPYLDTIIIVNNTRLNPYGDRLVMQNDPERGLNWTFIDYYSIGPTMEPARIFPITEAFIKVGEQYNDFEFNSNNPLDHADEQRERQKESVLYVRFKRNSQDYKNTNWIMCDINSGYPWPGFWLRAPPRIFFFGKYFKYLAGGSSVPAIVKINKNANSFYFYQFWREKYDGYPDVEGKIPRFIPPPSAPP
ncbi:MAG: hypothetical protein N3D10_04365, partial [Candidatus Micrarchaeota archaeon]|nr:hypothetical protein [Candidatus Micrarchaeota archaeon]